MAERCTRRQTIISCKHRKLNEKGRESGLFLRGFYGWRIALKAPSHRHSGAHHRCNDHAHDDREHDVANND